jgi:hypothetical protein
VGFRFAFCRFHGCKATVTSIAPDLGLARHDSSPPFQALVPVITKPERNENRQAVGFYLELKKISIFCVRREETDFIKITTTSPNCVCKTMFKVTALPDSPKLLVLPGK